MGIKSVSVILIENEVSYPGRLSMSQALCLAHAVSHFFSLYNSPMMQILLFHFTKEKPRPKGFCNLPQVT